MKKKLSLLLLLFIHFSSGAQKNATIKGNCNDSMVRSTPGKWLKQRDLTTSFTGMQVQEAYSRLDLIHGALMKLYPKPVGMDVRWKRSIGINYFGSTRKVYNTGNTTAKSGNGDLLHIAAFGYYANFAPHFCARTANAVVFMTGEQSESSTGIGITVNHAQGILLDEQSDDTWTINGHPVKMLTPILKEKWNGYDVHSHDAGALAGYVLIHRNGVLPYKPVTRKQYLDQCIIFQTKIYDDMIMAIKSRPRRSQQEEEAEKRYRLAQLEKQYGMDTKEMKTAWANYLASYQTDQQRRDEEMGRAQKIKYGELKKFTDELEKTTKEGLLDSAAMIRVRYYSDLIFETDPGIGYTLVTEDPAYIRKDLPAYVPQMIVLSWRWSDYPPHVAYYRLFKQDFSLEMLQAMIDK